MVSTLPTLYFQKIPSATGPAAATSSTIIYTTSTGPDGRTIYHLFKAVPARYDTPEGPVSGQQWVRGEDTYTIPAGAQPVNEFTAPWIQGNPGANSQNDWTRDHARAGDGRGTTYSHQQGMPPPGYPAYPFANTPFPPDPHTIPLVYPPGHVKAGQPIPQSRDPSPNPGAYPWAESPFGAYPPYPAATTPGRQPFSHSPAAPGMANIGPETPFYTGYNTGPSVYPPGHVKEGQPMPQSRAPSPNPAYAWTGYPSGYPSTPAATTPGGRPISHSPAAGGSGVGTGMPGYAGPSSAPLVYPPGHVKEGQPIPYSKPPSPIPSAHPPSRPLSGSYHSNPDPAAFHQGPSYPQFAGPSTSYPSTPYSGHDNQPGTSRSASGHLPSSSYPWDSNHQPRDNAYSDLHRQFAGLNLRPEDVPYGYPNSNYSRPPTRAPSRSSLPRSNTPFVGGGGGGAVPSVYPPGHVKEGQPIPRPRTPSPLPELFGEPPFRQNPPSPAAPAYSRPSPGMPEPMTVPRGPAEQLEAPEGFSRSVTRGCPLTFFYITKIQDMEYFWDSIPRMPVVLVDHDVFESDWRRLMQDLALAWAGKLPTIGTPQLRSELVKDLVDTWNSLFFFKRGVELVLYQGKRRRSGPHAGLLEQDLPDHEDPSDYPPSSSEDDSEDPDNRARIYAGRGNTYGNSMGRSGLNDVFEERRRHRQEDIARKRQKNRRRREKYREKKFSLYLTYVPPGATPEQSHLPGRFPGPNAGYDPNY
ncbi:hypothetical protein BDZ94DRAFT_1325533 [Collybia nuda]|uniref:Uncharacterized protein n=1 Tax=Collybia nuda TaxID=64659 RepID=A0A9P5XZ91_9AGAR|nr:hypothetical protein BDZ94DRAFT_1325533 [Collybia nuda]